ncbi:unnamed protein product [marine sediment metagenome]|uniref:SWIM-type domain-containing protein n=1 Tax=marine sediment metagenome TaxID=412755 RepID=X1E3Y6_9ZZZZ
MSFVVYVPSSSTPEKMFKVTYSAKRGWRCSCPHWIYRHPEGGCKHIHVAQAQRDGVVGVSEIPVAVVG